MNRKLSLFALSVVIASSIAACLTAAGPSGADGNVLLETITVPANGSSVTSTTSLDSGVTYQLRASGTAHAGCKGGDDTDAEWACFPDETEDNCGNDPNSTDLGIAIDDPDTGRVGRKQPFWGPFDPSHVYTIDYVGQGAPISLDYHDCTLGDNSGSFTVEIFGPDGTGEPDTQPPAVSISLDSPNGGTPDGQAGWFVSGPVVGTVTADDTATGGSSVTTLSCGSLSLTRSGIGTEKATGSFSIAVEGVTHISCTASDSAGNTSGPATEHVQLDTHAPAVSRNATADSCDVPGRSGWCKASQSAGYKAKDDTSGTTSPCNASPSAFCFYSTTSSGQGSSVTIGSGQACDAAGNCSSGPDAGPFKIDSVAPGVVRKPSLDSCSLPGNGGWCRGLQSAGFTASDATSGGTAPRSCDPGASCDFVITSSVQGNRVMIPSQFCDVAGNCNTSVSAGPFQIDSTAPQISVASTSCSLPGNNGWCRGTETADFTFADAVSGTASPCKSSPGSPCDLKSSTSTQGNGLVVPSGPACDAAGNCSASIDAGPFKIDSVQPGATHETSLDSCSKPGSPPWCPGIYTVGYRASDPGSGLASPCIAGPASSCTYTKTQSIEGPVAWFVGAGDLCDVAGNCNTYTEGIEFGVFIDVTPPTFAPTVGSGPIRLHGTTVANAHATDNVSGVATQSCDPVDTSSVGVHTLTCRATDRAGNSASVSVSYLVEYKLLGFFTPAPNANLRRGAPVDVAVALADVNGVRIPDSEALALQSSPCRVTFAATVPKSGTVCMTYYTTSDQFRYRWQTPLDTGPMTISVAVSYPGTSTTTKVVEQVTITT